MMHLMPLHSAANLEVYADDAYVLLRRGQYHPMHAFTAAPFGRVSDGIALQSVTHKLIEVESTIVTKVQCVLLEVCSYMYFWSVV